MLRFPFFAGVAAAAAVGIDTTPPTSLTPFTISDAARDENIQILHNRGDRPEEHVVLCDCKSPNNAQFKQMAYYEFAPDSSPDNTTSDINPATWVVPGGTTIGFFASTGTKFKAKIGSDVGEGQFAGTGDNGRSEPFSCYKKFKKSLYKTQDGSVCDGIYDCDHSTPPGTGNFSSTRPSTFINRVAASKHTTSYIKHVPAKSNDISSNVTSKHTVDGHDSQQRQPE
ncbi:hypothetical protein OQA88_8541 [Cercophora sp. LCS_1]